MPLLGKSSALTLYGYHFIPVVDVPTIFYFTARRTSPVIELALECINLSPLILILLLMAIISGFIAWLLEMPANNEQFPRSFLVGLFQVKNKERHFLANSILLIDSENHFFKTVIFQKKMKMYNF